MNNEKNEQYTILNIKLMYMQGTVSRQVMTIAHYMEFPSHSLSLRSCRWYPITLFEQLLQGFLSV